MKRLTCMLVIAAILAVGCLSTRAAIKMVATNAPAPGSGGPTPHLVFSTYLGGSVPFVPTSSALTFAQNAACDAQGNTYVTGATTVSDLPGTTNAFQPAPAADSTMSAFVAKYNPAGKLLWCTYLGGNNQSMGVGVAAMPNGGVAVVGMTTSDALFPIVNAYQPQNNQNSDYFVTVYGANGSITYSTFLGGSGVEGQLPPYADDQNSGNSVAVDAAGLVYVTGMTTSGGGSGEKIFPVTTNAIQSNLARHEKRLREHHRPHPERPRLVGLLQLSWRGPRYPRAQRRGEPLRQQHYRGRLYHLLELPHHTSQCLPPHCPAWWL